MTVPYLTTGCRYSLEIYMYKKKQTSNWPVLNLSSLKSQCFFQDCRGGNRKICFHLSKVMLGVLAYLRRGQRSHRAEVPAKGLISALCKTKTNRFAVFCVGTTQTIHRRRNKRRGGVQLWHKRPFNRKQITIRLHSTSSSLKNLQ